MGSGRVWRSQSSGQAGRYAGLTSVFSLGNTTANIPHTRTHQIQIVTNRAIWNGLLSGKCKNNDANTFYIKQRILAAMFYTNRQVVGYRHFYCYACVATSVTTNDPAITPVKNQKGLLDWAWYICQCMWLEIISENILTNASREMVYMGELRGKDYTFLCKFLFWDLDHYLRICG